MLWWKYTTTTLFKKIKNKAWQGVCKCVTLRSMGVGGYEVYKVSIGFYSILKNSLETSYSYYLFS